MRWRFINCEPIHDHAWVLGLRWYVQLSVSSHCVHLTQWVVLMVYLIWVLRLKILISFQCASVCCSSLHRLSVVSEGYFFAFLCHGWVLLSSVIADYFTWVLQLLIIACECYSWWYHLGVAAEWRNSVCHLSVTLDCYTWVYHLGVAAEWRNSVYYLNVPSWMSHMSVLSDYYMWQFHLNIIPAVTVCSFQDYTRIITIITKLSEDSYSSPSK